MLEYTKSILEKISFSEELFIKEFRKSLKWLQQSEIIELKYWIRSNYKNEFSSLQISKN